MGDIFVCVGVYFPFFVVKKKKKREIIYSGQHGGSWCSILPFPKPRPPQIPIPEPNQLPQICRNTPPQFQTSPQKPPHRQLQALRDPWWSRPLQRRGGPPERAHQTHPRIPIAIPSLKSSSITGEPIDSRTFRRRLREVIEGERGLRKFIEENPPPPKKDGEAPPDAGLGFDRAKAPKLPLLLPGMIAIVKNPNNPFYMYCGIVQLITDGKAGVLFEGGNWDRLVTFRLEELERRAKGPPMVNPRSAIFEEIVETP